jgi:hypothetical protein
MFTLKYDLNFIKFLNSDFNSNDLVYKFQMICFGEIDGDYTTLPIIFEDVYCDHIPMSNGKYRNIVEETTLYNYKRNSTY